MKRATLRSGMFTFMLLLAMLMPVWALPPQSNSRRNAQEQADANLRAAFYREAIQYYPSVRYLMTLHDENLVEGNNKYGPPVAAKE